MDERTLHFAEDMKPFEGVTFWMCHTYVIIRYEMGSSCFTYQKSEVGKKEVPRLHELPPRGQSQEVGFTHLWNYPETK